MRGDKNKQLSDKNIKVLQKAIDMNNIPARPTKRKNKPINITKICNNGILTWDAGDKWPFSCKLERPSRILDVPPLGKKLPMKLPG